MPTSDHPAADVSCDLRFLCRRRSDGLQLGQHPVELAFASSGDRPCRILELPFVLADDHGVTSRFDALSSAPVLAPTSVARRRRLGVAGGIRGLLRCIRCARAPRLLFTSLIEPSFLRVRSWVSRRTA
jgi:hypothetical protein